jgi:transcriptional regulator with XRE-family HTH domain
MARSGSSGIDRFLGHRLKQRRLALGMTRVEFAEALGISHQQMHKYESGTNQLSPHLIFSIAQLFGIRISDLFDGYGGCDQELASPDPDFARPLKSIFPG